MTVSRGCSQALLALGIKPGDRICAVVPNMPDTIAAFLATASLGAVWSSCSPDFGERGILDRFGQIAPRVLIACDGYYYAGKTLPLGDKIAAVLQAIAERRAGHHHRLYRRRATDIARDLAERRRL